MIVLKLISNFVSNFFGLKFLVVFYFKAHFLGLGSFTCFAKIYVIQNGKDKVFITAKNPSMILFKTFFKITPSGFACHLFASKGVSIVL